MNILFYFITGILAIILIFRFLFSIRSVKKFSAAVLPTITAIKEYMSSISHSLHEKSSISSLLIAKKFQLQKIWVIKSGMYPEWIFYSGFNPGLRAGMRFFLIHLERVAELLFAIEFIITDQSSDFYSYINNTSLPMIEVMKKNEELMAIIENYFQAEKIIEPKTNLTSDIVMLENRLQQIVPNSIDLLDISSEYIKLTALVRHVKDMRQVLLSLISALPERI